MNLFECSFLVFLKTLSHSLSMLGNFLRKDSVIVFKSIKDIAPSTMLPDTENKNELVMDSPIFVPKGIANFISENGIIAVRNVMTSGGRFMFPFYSLRKLW